ncbi:RcgR family putative quorum lactone hydrolase [Shinella sp.]|uniref:RcgR family putative quorum lactone hydrolase n=1 Tax=Shinella sp. TaxID=1870904 RepID=UPI003D26E742
MYHRWLDRWDERRAQLGEEGKTVTNFSLDATRAYSSDAKLGSLEEFCVFADEAVANPAFFDEPEGAGEGFYLQDGWLTFPSEMKTDIEENNTVYAKVTDSGARSRALVVFHHWNARSRNMKLARFFSRRGITVVEIAMPYHLERSRPGSSHADYMLSANLGRTIQSVRQAVWDGRKLIRWLGNRGYRDISVLGMSLGSWIAGLIAAHDLAVSKAALFLTADSLAEMVWTGRATHSIRESLEPHVDLAYLRRAWSPLDLANYAHLLARPGLDLHVVLAKRDKVVIPVLSRRFMLKMESVGARPTVMRLDCGHYSLALPPYGLVAGSSLRRFLSGSGKESQ